MKYFIFHSIKISFHCVNVFIAEINSLSISSLAVVKEPDGPFHICFKLFIGRHRIDFCPNDRPAQPCKTHSVYLLCFALVFHPTYKSLISGANSNVAAASAQLKWNRKYCSVSEPVSDTVSVWSVAFVLTKHPSWVWHHGMGGTGATRRRALVLQQTNISSRC